MLDDKLARLARLTGLGCSGWFGSEHEWVLYGQAWWPGDGSVRPSLGVVVCPKAENPTQDLTD